MVTAFAHQQQMDEPTCDHGVQEHAYRDRARLRLRLRQARPRPRSGQSQRLPWLAGPWCLLTLTSFIREGQPDAHFNRSARECLVARVLGDEIRQARKACGWTRKQLQAYLPTRISVQTLATYELGTRQCSVARLVELCDAMNVFAHDCWPVSMSVGRAMGRAC